MAQDSDTKSEAMFLKKLNPEQRAAVEAIDGPLMVLAGPGTGKTQVIAARIAYILQHTDTNPNSILAITFTDAAAKNMRERLVSLIGHAGYYVSVQTFHAFCNDVLIEHTDLFPMHPASQALSDVERFSIIETLLTDMPLDVLKPINAPRHYAKKIIEAISNLKKEGVTTDAFAEIVSRDFAEAPDTKSKQILAKFARDKAKNEELVGIYQAYQAELSTRARYDYDDMIMMVVDGLKSHPFLLQSIQEQYHYFLVDEYQDTNEAQNQLLWQLSSHWEERANVCVVGDPHQAIYRFQGASVENTYSFLAKFPQAKIITLKQAYRCPQPIYDAAHSLISHNTLTAQDSTAVEVFVGEQLQQRLISQHKDSGKPAVSVLTTPSDVAEWMLIAESISTLLKDGVAARDIAVLTKTNAQSIRLSEILRSHGIPTQMSAQSNALDNTSVQSILQLLAIIEALRSAGSVDQLLTVLLQPWWQLEPAVLYQLGQRAAAARMPLYQFIKEKPAAELAVRLLETQTADIEKVQQVVKQLETLGQLELTLSCPLWLQTVLEQSGVLAWLQEDIERYPDLLAVVSLVEHVGQWAANSQPFKLPELLATIQVLIVHNLSLPATSTTFIDEAVELSTVHGAKGKEWEYVFIPHCTDGVWGNSKRSELLTLPPTVLRYTDISKKEKNEDERRVFYVALTRARQHATCTYPEKYLTQGKQKDQVISMFLSEAGFTPESDVASSERTVRSQHLLAQLLAPPAQMNLTPAVHRLLLSLVDQLKFSATSLNRYLRSPEEFVLKDLLGLRQVPEAHMIYGTAVHAGLEELTKRMIADRGVDMVEVFAILDASLKRGELPQAEHNRRLEHGRRVLETYQKQHIRPDQPILSTERVFGTSRHPIVLDGVQLSGRIDRIDWVDAKAKTARVIDYKLSKAKSVNDLAGKTGLAGLSEREQALQEHLRHPHKRQMLFYKILTDLDPSFQPQVVAGTFEYLNATSDPIVVQRELPLEHEAVEDLKQLIAEITTELRSLAFLDQMHLR